MRPFGNPKVCIIKERTGSLSYYQLAFESIGKGLNLEKH